MTAFLLIHDVDFKKAYYFSLETSASVIFFYVVSEEQINIMEFPFFFYLSRI